MSKWLPGARVLKATQDGGSMIGGHPRVTWHTTENDPHVTRAVDIASFLNRTGSQVHLVWNPVTGEIVQMIPSNRAGRGLENHVGGVETNRQGSVHIQIEVVGKAVNPFTDGPCKGLDRIVRWLRKHGIQDRWPSGKSIAYPASYGDNGHRGFANWLKGGHYAHQNVPENVHGDAGAINQKKILNAGDPPAKKTLVSAPVIGDLQAAVHLTRTKKWGSSTNKGLEAVRKGHPTEDVVFLQKRVGANPDGVWGIHSKAAYTATVKKVQAVLGVRKTGRWDRATDDAYSKLKRQYHNVYTKK